MAVANRSAVARANSHRPISRQGRTRVACAHVFLLFSQSIPHSARGMERPQWSPCPPSQTEPCERQLLRGARKFRPDAEDMCALRAEPGREEDARLVPDGKEGGSGPPSVTHCITGGIYRGRGGELSESCLVRVSSGHPAPAANDRNESQAAARSPDR